MTMREMAFTARALSFFLAGFLLGFSAVVAAEGIYKEGDVVLGALLTVRHKNSDDSCGVLKPQGLAYVEAMLYAIDSINSDENLLPNITLGYDIVDSCDSPALANQVAYEFVTRNQATQVKYATNDTKNFKTFFGDLRNPVVAVIGTGDSSSSVVVANMLQVGNISQISPFATSEELSLQYFKTFFRPVPPDGQQAKALADVIDYFKWKYVMVVGVDTSYGRYGVMALENESQERSTFCISEISYFPPSGYQNKITTIVSKIKRAENIKVVVLWGGPTTSIHFIQEASRQGIYGENVVGSRRLVRSNTSLQRKILADYWWFCWNKTTKLQSKQLLSTYAEVEFFCSESYVVERVLDAGERMSESI